MKIQKIKEIKEALDFMAKTVDVSKIALDNLTTALEELDEQFSLYDVSIMLPSPDKLYKMAETIVDRQKRIIDLPNKESIDWEDLKNDWFDWLDDEIKGN